MSSTLSDSLTAVGSFEDALDGSHQFVPGGIHGHPSSHSGVRRLNGSSSRCIRGSFGPNRQSFGGDQGWPPCRASGQLQS